MVAWTRGRKMWLDTGYILRVGAKGIADGLDVGHEKEYSGITPRFFT